MAKKDVTRRNFKKVVAAIVKQFDESDRDTQTVWANSLNDYLDDLSGEDFFGTEGQNDPRGDQRD